MEGNKLEYAEKYRRQREKIRELLEHIDQQKDELFSETKKLAI